MDTVFSQFSQLGLDLRYHVYDKLTVSILSQDEGYVVIYSLCLREFPGAKSEETPEGEGYILLVLGRDKGYRDIREDYILQ